jgi:hypothetical protein
MVERPRPSKMDNRIFPNSEFKRRLILIIIFGEGVLELRRGNRFEERGREGRCGRLYNMNIYQNSI